MQMDPQQVVRRFYTLAWNEGSFDDARSLLDQDLVDHDPLPVPGVRSGAAGLLDVIGLIRTGLPDLSRTIEVQVGQDEMVATRFVDEGTHLGELFGIAPTGRRIRVVGINIERIVDGRIVEIWHVEDIAGLMAQIGGTVSDSVA
jgi:predicted ester cyclase